MPETTARLSILLLNYDHPELLDARLTEFEMSLPRGVVEVIALDNGAPRGRAQLVMARHLDGGLILEGSRVEANLGFGGGFNHLATLAHTDRLVFYSDDVRSLGDWVTPLEAIFNQNPGDVVIAHRIVSFGAGWNQFGAVTVPYPEGYFLAVPKATWEKLGGFDPRYLPYDYEDVDLGMSAQKAGIPLVAQPELPLQHIGAQTLRYAPDRYDSTCRMRAKFAEKWGLPNDPARP